MVPTLALNGLGKEKTTAVFREIKKKHAQNGVLFLCRFAVVFRVVRLKSKQSINAAPICSAS